ncbi:uridine kinase family protein [Ekhidna sp.]|uniref:uridine kinase family protein n=1 Tax=Ekhidna sp. TaxID=2608089 RepID=UPI003CCB8649
MSLIIGIGGASQSGKSTLSKRLEKLFSQKKVHIIEMDKYTFLEKNIPKINGLTNWEVPESIDFNKILEAIKDSRQNYDIIIVEGMLAFIYETLNKEYDLTIFMKIGKNTFIRRREKETRWGSEPAWYLKHVWEAYLRFGQYPAADIVISGENITSANDLTPIIQKINATMS